MMRSLAGLLLAGVTAQLAAQAPPKGRLMEIVVRGASLEGNLVGESAHRNVAVYLPPSYDGSSKRYPVLYVLHGINDSPKAWTEAWGPPSAPNPGYATIQDLMDKGIASGALQEMIVVVPDADKSCHYTDSPVKGGWGTFIAKDLVQFVDTRFRTAAGASGRGVLGHSMGGHGAIKLAMTHPGTFSAVYAMNPSLLGWAGDVSADNTQLAAAARFRRPADLARANFYERAVIGIGQCFSPDRESPLLTAVPFTVGTDGKPQPGPAYARWTEQMPLYMSRSRADALKMLRGLGFDSAFEDEFTHIPPTSKALHALFDSIGIAHTFELYEGDHRNRLWGERGRLFTVALPFLSRLLTAEAPSVMSASAARSLVPSEAPATLSKAQVKLWDAARSGKVRDAESALKGGADVNALDTRTNQNGRRPLNYAAELNRADMIRWLVTNGADVNRPNRTGFTALHHAAEYGSVQATEALLALGADPTAPLPTGSTPLTLARQRGRTEIVRLLEKALAP
jgi:S-formylglutathione hydrolase FrmB